MRAMNDRDLNIWCDVSMALRDAADLDSELADDCAERILPEVRRIAARAIRRAADDVHMPYETRMELYARADALDPTTVR